METVISDLSRYSTHSQPINLTFHQYLLHTDEPLLVHTGNVHQAATLLPQLKASLRGQTLEYIFVSHFEADECGGLITILKDYPHAQIICSGDLMMRFGEATDQVVASDWQTEIYNIRPEQIPDSERRTQLQRTLARLDPKYVSTGHGPNLDLHQNSYNGEAHRFPA